jgi:MarR family multiple antibiotic resistance transcriptional regulator
VEILQSKSNPVKAASRKADTVQVMSMVQGFVQMWIKFEAELHREIALRQQDNSDEAASKRLHSYIDYGTFYRVSSNLQRNRSLSMGELSSALSVPFSKATRIVDGMVTDGYLTRLQDPDDRRVIKVALTQEGNKLHKTIESFTGEHVQEILSGLTHEEQEILFVLIRKVVSALEKVT